MGPVPLRSFRAARIGSRVSREPQDDRPPLEALSAAACRHDGQHREDQQEDTAQEEEGETGQEVPVPQLAEDREGRVHVEHDDPQDADDP